MGDTTTTTTTTPTPAEKRLLAFAKGSRFAGSLYRDVAGRAVAATDGIGLVVPGADSVESAVDAVDGATPEGLLPPVRTLQQLINGFLRDTGPLAPSAEVSLTTEPDAERRHSTELQLLSEDAAAALAVERAEARLAARPRGYPELRRDLAAARRDLRAARRRRVSLDTPLANALIVGEVGFDLRLVHRALRALGAKRGTLHATGPFDPAALVTDRGIALVMPCRMS